MKTYNIDKILSESPNDMEVADTLRLCLGDVPRNDLLPEERVVIDAWIFSYCMGNGLDAMIVNSQFDEIANGLAALMQLDDPRLHDFVSSIADIFRRYGLDPSTPDGLWPIADLADSTYDALEVELNKAESPHLSTIWGNAIHESFGRYLRAHIEVLRSRKSFDDSTVA